MNDEVIRLILDMGRSGADVEEVTRKLDEMRRSSQGVVETYTLMARLGDGYEVLARKATEADVAMDRLVASAVEQTRAQKIMNQTVEETVMAKTAWGNVSAANSQRILELGRGVQDFAQGGLAGIINNIERIVGGGGLAAGALTALGTALLLTKPYWEDWLKVVFEGGKDKIPETANRMERLTDEIKKQKDELEELRKKQSLDFSEMEKYREGVDKLAKSEEELRNARAVASVDQYANKADKARATAFREGLGEFGGGEKLVEALKDFGVDQKRAEEMVAEGLKGNRNEISNILNRVPVFDESYTSPQEAAQRKAQDEVQKRIKQDVERKNRDAEDQARQEGRLAAELEREKEREEKRQKQERDRDAREMAAEAAAAEAPAPTPRQRAIGRARRDVGQVAQMEGLGSPNPEQAEKMAADAVRNMTMGMTRQEAAWMAVYQQVQAMQRAAMQLHGATTRMQGMSQMFTPPSHYSMMGGGQPF